MKVLKKFFGLGKKSDMNVEKVQLVRKYRNFGCVVYPDSAPENWMDIISDMHVPCFISPLHDHDISPVGNEPEKPHYHVMFMYEREISFDQIKEVVSSFGGFCGMTIISARDYAQYLCHLGNPDKNYQYDPEDVKLFAGADYLSICGLAADV